MKDLSKVFDDFENISSKSELRRTLQVGIEEKTYRIEVLFSYSHPTAPWNIHAELRVNGAWKRIPRFPWIQERDEEAAIRTALSFLEDRHQK